MARVTLPPVVPALPCCPHCGESLRMSDYYNQKGAQFGFAIDGCVGNVVDPLSEDGEDAP